uniref:Ricin B-type lectin domain-containing protein n=1 Tax=Anisakis simplex TaxID=6269 RepID=A0A0M3J1D4_ANISI
LVHVVSDKCLEMSHDGSKLMVRTCDVNNTYQQWIFQDYNEEKAKEFGLL